MRGKARGADRGNEVRNQSGKGEKKTGGECVMTEGRPWRSPFNTCDAVGKDKTYALMDCKNSKYSRIFSSLGLTNRAYSILPFK